ncbi:MAG: hypothetical protein MUD01_23020 [Chloroflexaceae bacterium]|nr:hypothetical protein [Chloroflexaceae bacterium]
MRGSAASPGASIGHSPVAARGVVITGHIGTIATNAASATAFACVAAPQLHIAYTYHIANSHNAWPSSAAAIPTHCRGRSTVGKR